MYWIFDTLSDIFWVKQKITLLMSLRNGWLECKLFVVHLWLNRSGLNWRYPYRTWLKFCPHDLLIIFYTVTIKSIERWLIAAPSMELTMHCVLQDVLILSSDSIPEFPEHCLLHCVETVMAKETTTTISKSPNCYSVQVIRINSRARCCTIEIPMSHLA